MAVSVANVFGKEYIDALLSLPEVVAAKQKIDAATCRTVHFTVPLDAGAKDILRERLGLNLAAVDAVPMRWIKGDTAAHADTGFHAFENTYLVYLTDSPGLLIVDGQSYPIRQGTAYVFSEGLRHETVQTGVEPRLLMGPMSEAGSRVGGPSISGPGGSTVYIRQNGSDIEYSLNKLSWFNFYFPAAVYNTDTEAGVLRVEFTTDITIVYNNFYFYCGTSHIQFGSSSLNEDGSRPVITIDGVANYPGLIQNGGDSYSGNNTVSIYNLEVSTVNGSTLAAGGGWIGQAYFGKGVSNNYIINCYSTGGLPGASSGGIVGSYAGSGTGASLKIIGCSSSGAVGQLDGGIAGAYAGANGGNVQCEQSWSTGIIQGFAGGIFGDYAGDSGAANAGNCYSIGSIGNSAGGIFGRFAGNNGIASAQRCYSRGAVDTDGGGIYGIGAGSDGGTTFAINCYSAGIITTSGRGIYGTGKANGSDTNCYVANGTWSSVAANAALQGLPNPVVGLAWTSTGVDQPYELSFMGYTPYTIANITAVPELNRSFESSIDPGGSTAAAIVSGKSYTILQITSAGSAGTFTIDSTTGVISTTIDTEAGSYILYIRNTGSYNITTHYIYVSGGSGGATGVSCCSRRLNLRHLDYTTRAEVLGGNVVIGGVRGKNLTHGEYLRIKKAYAFKR